MSKISLVEVQKKKEFLLSELDYGMFIEEKNGRYALFNDFGTKGTECVCAGTLSDINNYLNRLLRKYHLVEDWKVLKLRYDK